jgi:hypothetical protein
MVNPSNITITVGDINFEVHMPEFSNANVGIVYMKQVTITPGAAVYKATMHMGEGATSSEAVAKLLTYYLTSAIVPLNIVGTLKSTTIAPLVTALSGIELSSPLTGIDGGLIKNILITGSSDQMIQEPFLANAQITLYNPLDTPFTLLSVKAETSKYVTCPGALEMQYKTVVVGNIDYVLPSPLVIPAKSTVTSDIWPVNVSHDTGGVMATLLGKDFFYNVTQYASVIVGDGFQSSNMYFFQNHVPYRTELADGIDRILEGMCGDEAALLSIGNNGTNTTTTISTPPATTLLPTSTSIDITTPTTATFPQPTTEAPATETQTTTEAPTAAPSTESTTAPEVAPETSSV